MSFLFALFMTAAQPACAKLNIVATTADVQAIVRAVGADDIELAVLAKGSQDPHSLEAKPSLMVKLRDADLLVSNGLSLEIGWLPSLIRGARNPKVNPGSRGFLELGTLIEPIEKPRGPLTRSDGDVHPDGNPHFTLDPIRVGQVARKVAERLGELDPAKKENFEKRARDYATGLEEKTADWKSRIAKTGAKRVVTYHPSMNYFLDRMGLGTPIFLEAKPGVPPSAQHILDVIAAIKSEKIKVILVDNFFDTKIADRVAAENPGTRVVSVGVSTDSAPGLKGIEDVIEQLVGAVEGR